MVSAHGLTPRAASGDGAVGIDLANAVAVCLEAGRVLAFSHRDYCGVGLRWLDGKFICAEVFDGEIATAAATPSGEQLEYLSFQERDEFVAWLAGQTDESLSGRHLPDAWLHGNQRMTIARLLEFVG